MAATEGVAGGAVSSSGWLRDGPAGQQAGSAAPARPAGVCQCMCARLAIYLAYNTKYGCIFAKSHTSQEGL
jgi:hypothetical protein